MNKIWSGLDSGDWLYPHVLEGLQKYWAEYSKFLQKSAIGKQKRAKDLTTPRYTGGSISIPTHYKKLKQEIERDPIAFEVMESPRRLRVMCGSTRSPRELL